MPKTVTHFFLTVSPCAQLLEQMRYSELIAESC